MWFGEPHPFPEKEDHLPDWARRDNKDTKGDRVENLKPGKDLFEKKNVFMFMEVNKGREGIA